jgi:hypothetical protein
MVSAELQSLSTSNHTPQKQMCILATGLLALNLASITGVSRNVAKGESIAKREQRKSRIAQAEKLYSDLITVGGITLHRLNVLLTASGCAKTWSLFCK